MKILEAKVQNHQGWSEAKLLVEQNSHKARLHVEWEWEDRDGCIEVLEADDGFDENRDLYGDIYEADGYETLVGSKLEAIV